MTAHFDNDCRKNYNPWHVDYYISASWFHQVDRAPVFLNLNNDSVQNVKNILDKYIFFPFPILTYLIFSLIPFTLYFLLVAVENLKKVTYDTGEGYHDPF